MDLRLQGLWLKDHKFVSHMGSEIHRCSQIYSFVGLHFVA